MGKTGVCTSLHHVHTIPSNTEREEGRRWSPQRQPPHLRNMLNWDMDEIISASASGPLIATQLMCVWIGVPLLSDTRGAGGTEWRCVDFDVCQSTRRLN
jgi:hypothetical protein